MNANEFTESRLPAPMSVFDLRAWQQTVDPLQLPFLVASLIGDDGVARMPDEDEKPAVYALIAQASKALVQRFPWLIPAVVLAGGQFIVMPGRLFYVLPPDRRIWIEIPGVASFQAPAASGAVH